VSGLQIGIAAYCGAMAAASRLVPLCPCCTEAVRIARLVATFAWIGLGAWALLSRSRKAEMWLAVSALSAVQVANFWTQLVHQKSLAHPSSWIVPAAAAGCLVSVTMALAARRRVAAA